MDKMKKEIIEDKGCGLVLEGGGLRGMFTNGIIDVFMEHGIKFDALVGVSAGVLFGCNYKSMQPGRALRYNLKYKDEPKYMSWSSLRRTGDFVNADFAYREIPYFLDPFDFKKFSSNPMKFYAVCTDLNSRMPVYHEIADARGDGLKWMRASSSMPVFAKPVEIDGHLYLDGGITDSIPLEFIQKKGYKKNIVILTQPVGYRKKKAHVKIPLRILLRKYPQVADMMSVRHIMYNKELDYIQSEETKGNTLLIYPDKKLNIGRLDLDEYKIYSVYEAGVSKAMEMLPVVRKFLEQDSN